MLYVEFKELVEISMFGNKKIPDDDKKVMLTAYEMLKRVAKSCTPLSLVTNNKEYDVLVVLNNEYFIKVPNKISYDHCTVDIEDELIYAVAYLTAMRYSIDDKKRILLFDANKVMADYNWAIYNAGDKMANEMNKDELQRVMAVYGNEKLYIQKIKTINGYDHIWNDQFIDTLEKYLLGEALPTLTKSDLNNIDTFIKYANDEIDVRKICCSSVDSFDKHLSTIGIEHLEDVGVSINITRETTSNEPCDCIDKSCYELLGDEVEPIDDTNITTIVNGNIDLPSSEIIITLFEEDENGDWFETTTYTTTTDTNGDYTYDLGDVTDGIVEIELPDDVIISDILSGTSIRVPSKLDTTTKDPFSFDEDWWSDEEGETFEGEPSSSIETPPNPTAPNPTEPSVTDSTNTEVNNDESMPTEPNEQIIPPNTEPIEDEVEYMPMVGELEHDFLATSGTLAVAGYFIDEGGIQRSTTVQGGYDVVWRGSEYTKVDTYVENSWIDEDGIENTTLLLHAYGRENYDGVNFDWLYELKIISA